MPKSVRGAAATHLQSELCTHGHEHGQRRVPISVCDQQLRSSRQITSITDSIIPLRAPAMIYWPHIRSLPTRSAPSPPARCEQLDFLASGQVSWDIRDPFDTKAYVASDGGSNESAAPDSSTMGRNRDRGHNVSHGVDRALPLPKQTPDLVVIAGLSPFDFLEFV